MIATVSRRKPSLLVRWTAPIGHDISYVVQYSSTNQNTPPNDALELISYSASILLSIGIQSGTTYYVWVCAISNKLHGKYSRREMNTTFQGTHEKSKIPFSYMLYAYSVKRAYRGTKPKESFR